MYFISGLGKVRKDTIELEVSSSVAIQKGGQRPLVDNHQPVVPKCMLCKCLVKVIRRHRLTHLTENVLLPKAEQNSLEGTSCLPSLPSLLDDAMADLNGWEFARLLPRFNRGF